MPKENKRTQTKPSPVYPPDPEDMNPARADWANVALAAFRVKTGTDAEDALSDLLCDLMHWADYNGEDFEVQYARARGHYEDETFAVDDD